VNIVLHNQIDTCTESHEQELASHRWPKTTVVSNPGTYTVPIVIEGASGEAVVELREIGVNQQLLYTDTNIISNVLTKRDQQFGLQAFVWRAADRGHVFVPPTCAEEFARHPTFHWGLPDAFQPAVQGYDQEVVSYIVKKLFDEVKYFTSVAGFDPTELSSHRDQAFHLKEKGSQLQNKVAIFLHMLVQASICISHISYGLAMAGY
jgi:hypothetical protein